MHGGPLQGDGRPNWELQYRCEHGIQWNSLLAMSVCLCETKKEDGGFAVVKGSHKCNFPIPSDFAAGFNEDFIENYVAQPVTSPGDVIFFSEATIHGALPWRADRQRRLALYRFAPPTVAYGRAYEDAEKPFGVDLEKAEKFKLTQAQQAVLLGPFANRLDRPTIEVVDNGAVVTKVTERSQIKKDHDLKIFGTKWF